MWGALDLLQVIGCDGKKSLINAGCATFPAAVMLLRSNYAKQNIKEKLKDLVGNIELRKTVYTSIFGNEFTIALVYTDSLKVFDLRLAKSGKWIQSSNHFANILKRIKQTSFDIM